MYSMTCPVPPAVPVAPMIDSVMSLAVTPGPRLPLTSTFMFFALRWISVWVASTCSTSRGADAVRQRPEGAVGRGVAVAADDGHARLGPALLRADDVHDPLADVADAVVLDAEVLGVLLQRLDLDAALLVLDAAGAVDVGRHVVVGHRHGLARRAHLAAGHAQALEGLRARHLVHEVAVDVEQAGAVGRLVHQVGVPDLVVEGFRCGHGFLRARMVSTDGGRRAASGARREAPKPRPWNRHGRRAWSSMSKIHVHAAWITAESCRRQGGRRKGRWRWTGRRRSTAGSRRSGRARRRAPGAGADRPGRPRGRPRLRPGELDRAPAPRAARRPARRPRQLARHDRRGARSGCRASRFDGGRHRGLGRSGAVRPHPRQRGAAVAARPCARCCRRSSRGWRRAAASRCRCPTTSTSRRTADARGRRRTGRGPARIARRRRGCGRRGTPPDWYWRLLRGGAARVEVWRTIYSPSAAGRRPASSTGCRPPASGRSWRRSARTSAPASSRATRRRWPRPTRPMPDGTVLLPFPRLFLVAAR